jgi:hypothetical protein
VSKTTRRSLIWSAAAATAVGTGTLQAQAPPQPLAEGAPARAQQDVSKPVAPPPDADARLAVVSGAVTDLQQRVSQNSAPSPVDATTANRQLYDRDSGDWTALQKKAQELYGVSPDLATKAPVSAPAHIAFDFKFAARTDDMIFRFQFAEILLDQAADLLERALNHRTEWNALASTSFNVSAEIQQFLELDKIHKEETIAGYYTHDAAEAGADALGLANTLNLNTGHLAFITNVLMTVVGGPEWNRTLDASELLGWLAHQPIFSNSAQNTTYAQYGWDGAPNQTAPDLAIPATQQTTSHSLAVDNASWGAQLQAAQQAAARLQGQAASTSVKKNWEASNSGFRFRRTEVLRRLADAKSKAYTNEDGALNYPLQLNLLKARFNRDLRDALARTSAAAAGLNKLYGYAIALPISVQQQLAGGASSPSAFDECLGWVRDAIAYLTKMAYLEQRYALPVSVKRMSMTPATFVAGKSAVPMATWTFGVPEGTFPGQFNVRLRGVSVIVQPKVGLGADQIGANSLGVWSGDVLPPSNSYCTHSVPGAALVQQALIQNYVSPAPFGRASHRDSPRDPEILGSKNFFNLSPFGQWRLRLNPMSSTGIGLDKVDDLILDLSLAVRTSA